MRVATSSRDAATVTMLRILYFGVSLIGVAFSVLGYSQNVSERTHLQLVWALPSFVLLLLLPLIIVIGSAWMPLSLLRAISAVQIMVFCVALLTWPLGVTDDHVFDGARPWIFGHVATTVSLIGILLPERAAWISVTVVSIATGALRVGAEGVEAVPIAIADSLFNLMIATVLVSIIQVTLRAGRARDSAAAATARASAITAAVEAKNLQRSRVAAIIHDDVISTLIVAARFDEGAGDLVRGYASKALGRLDVLKTSVTRSDEVISSDTFGATLRSTAPVLASDVAFTLEGVPLPLPTAVSEALLEASAEALRNSQRHAGIAARAVTVATTDASISVTVVDDGRGFDLHHIPLERFGISVSIRERMASVGGSSQILTSPGNGTRVTLLWAAPA